MASSVSAQRKYRYGLTAHGYKSMLIEQHGKCAACGEGETVLSRSGGVRSLSVDHCHKTGQIRGLLCDRCNNILGRSKDSPEVLRRLASYVEVTAARKINMYLDADAVLAEISLLPEGVL